MNIQTNKFENFLPINDIEKEMIICTCTCQKNLECLSVSELFMDGTYKCCPKFFKQLYTIHGLRNGHYVPLVFVLLSGKSECVYNHYLASLVELCSNRTITLKPEIIHVDFEDAMMKAMRVIFPRAVIKCCRFHLGMLNICVLN
jgi:hypothetical protein